MPDGAYGDRGEVDHTQRWVVLSGMHDITGFTGVDKLLLAVQERVAQQVDVTIVTEWRR